MFEQAAKVKLRFETPAGYLTVEDLFDLPLTSSRGVSLDDIAKQLNREIKSSAEESFVTEQTAADARLQLAFDIVKHVIAYKKNKAAEAQEAANKKYKKQQLLELITEKKNEQLKSSSVEELEAMVAAL